MRRFSLLVLLAATPIACSSRAPAPAPPYAADFPGDSALFTVLASEPGPAQLEAFERYEEARGMFMTDTLAEIVADTTIHPFVRANALLLIGRRNVAHHLILLAPALEATDVRIRLAAVAALREYLTSRPVSATRLLGIALADSSPAVQARALEALADREPSLLRQYLDGSPPPELARVATDLLRVAEERGAALEPFDSTGRLVRIGPGGHRLVYRPTRKWTKWELSTGPLSLVSENGDSVLIDAVEVAGRVVPAFFSADGRWLVYEADRTIRVRDVTTATTREVAHGIAPRVFPFTDEFLFLREQKDARRELRDGTRLQYELMRAPFDARSAKQPQFVRLIGANANFSQRGAASPARWMRVIERTPGVFALAGTGLDTVPLPDPFASQAETGR